MQNGWWSYGAYVFALLPSLYFVPILYTNFYSMPTSPAESMIKLTKINKNLSKSKHSIPNRRELLKYRYFKLRWLEKHHNLKKACYLKSNTWYSAENFKCKLYTGPLTKKTFYAPAVIGFKERFWNMYGKVPLSSRWTVLLSPWFKTTICTKGIGKHKDYW